MVFWIKIRFDKIWFNWKKIIEKKIKKKHFLGINQIMKYYMKDLIDKDFIYYNKLWKVNKLIWLLIVLIAQITQKE
jgi:hypothetical protein